VGAAANVLWTEALAGIRAAGRAMAEALEWARQQSMAVLEIVVGAMKAIGEAIDEALEWAKGVAGFAWDVFAGIVHRVKYSVEYVLSYLHDDFLPGLRGFVVGLLKLGFQLTELVAWTVGRTAQALVEVVAAVFEAGVVFRDFIAATAAHPEDVLENLMAAAKAYGKTLKEMVSAAIEQALEDMKKRTVDALRELGYTALEVLNAAAEIGGGALATVFTILLQWFGEYRSLTPEEKADAANVFGRSVDLDKVHVAVLSLPVDLIQKVNSERPFTTMYLLNFASWAEVTRETLIHEITHVWQGLIAGPIYMLEALHAQFFGEGYDYGGVTGLENAGGDFSKFNREQQAAIVEDYFKLRFVQALPENDYKLHLQYAQTVFAA
jgi:hypothetical protein